MLALPLEPSSNINSLRLSYSAFTAKLCDISPPLLTLYSLRVENTYCFILYSVAVLPGIENNNHPHQVLDTCTWLICCCKRDRQVAFCWVPAQERNKWRHEVAEAAIFRSVPACPLSSVSSTGRFAVYRWEALVTTTKMGKIISTSTTPCAYA